ncbi:MAG: ribonuclease H-like domain-containing protein [Saprospiraceae bacterium]|jgi:DNA polymerase elongation subunit (family B)|nr:ribonuclease H-like domain-containing protein [Saprospiraceae bacterium]MBL0025350.1 ribonuclease H-like domain-containing protein [Saprospiraceae bacterium]
MFLEKHFLKRCLFIDIETVSEYPDVDSLPENKRVLWSIKANHIRKSIGSREAEFTDSDLYISKAGIFAEFAKVCCISMGFLHFEDNTPSEVRVKSLAGEDEGRILEDFSRVLVNHYNDPENSRICGHNIKEFDIPFLCRRMVINQIRFPPVLDISGKKPWQTSHILDTMDMWRFGDYKNYTSLDLLAATLNIASPKDDIDGSMVGTIYWKDDDIDRIVNYCQKDVVSVIQVMMKFAGLPLFSEDSIEYINQKE